MTESVSCTVPFTCVKIPTMRKLYLRKRFPKGRFLYVHKAGELSVAKRKRKRSRNKSQSHKVNLPRSRSCRFWTEQYKDARVNCATCVKFNRETGRCKDEEEVVQKHDDTREIERLMRHDAFRRGEHGGIRQIRRWTT